MLQHVLTHLGSSPVVEAILVYAGRVASLIQWRGWYFDMLLKLVLVCGKLSMHPLFWKLHSPPAARRLSFRAHAFRFPSVVMPNEYYEGG